MGRDMRTFVALRVGPPLRERLHRRAARLADLEPGLRPVALEDLHTTLQFLGGTSDADVYRVSRALQEIGARHPPIELVYRGLGAFPEPGRARVVWAGVREPPDTAGRLATLVSELGEVLGALGFPPERRRFHAHVTLGRLRRRPGTALVEALAEEEEADLGAEVLSEVKLIVSDPGHRPYHYIDLTTVDLEGEART